MSVDNSEERKVSGMGVSLGVLLQKQSRQFLRNYLKVSSKMSLKKSEFADWLSINVFKGQSLWDDKFYFEGIDFWNVIKRIWWGNEEIYTADVNDCDNYSGAFQSDMSVIFGMNSAGKASGQVCNATTGKFISRHSFSLIVVVVDGKLKPYLFEPMDKTMTEWSGQKTKLGKWTYEIDWIDFG